MFVLNGVEINFLLLFMRNDTPIHGGIWTCRQSNDLWQDAMNVWRYDAWTVNLRMSLATFMFVVEQLTPTLAKESTKFRATIPVSKQVMIAICWQPPMNSGRYRTCLALVVQQLVYCSRTCVEQSKKCKRLNTLFPCWMPNYE